MEAIFRGLIMTFSLICLNVLYQQCFCPVIHHGLLLHWCLKFLHEFSSGLRWSMCDFVLGASFAHFVITKQGSSACSQNIYSYLQQKVFIYFENHSSDGTGTLSNHIDWLHIPHMDMDFTELVNARMFFLEMSIFSAKQLRSDFLYQMKDSGTILAELQIWEIS